MKTLLIEDIIFANWTMISHLIASPQNRALEKKNVTLNAWIFRNRQREIVIRLDLV